MKRLEETGVGCHMDSRFTEALAYADDITLLAPCKSALSILISVCEKYASEFDILFNGSKSKLLFFKGRFSNGMESGIMLNPIRSELFQTVNDPGGALKAPPPLRSRKLSCQSSSYHTCEFYQVFLA